MNAVPVSVLVPVRNEARNIERCLASVRWADQVVVVDSQSTDGTIGLAQSLGAEVVQFQYDGRGPKKKEWALRTLPLRHEWVLLLDADEVMPADAEAEIRAIVTAPVNGTRGYWINRRFLFLGRWLRHAYYPNWNLRLFQHRHARFEQLTDGDTGSGDVEIHEHVLVDGDTGRLASEMDHFAFPTLTAFVEKHNRYASWEAHVAIDGNGRRAVQSLRYRLPFRPLLRFLYVYVWQRGFLDGREGYYFARLHAFYEFLSVAKTYELRRSRRER
jgi:glycosyltransferase involved in cell wall biosynthesis